MIFLIEYDRHAGRLVEIKSFSKADRRAAEKLRLQTELQLNRYGVNHEIVLLEAANKEALQRTHRRYFENVLELADRETVVGNR
jgi:hypothetical protein